MGAGASPRSSRRDPCRSRLQAVPQSVGNDMQSELPRGVAP